MENVNVVKGNECSGNACTICGSDVDVTKLKGKCVCMECVGDIGKL